MEALLLRPLANRPCESRKALQALPALVIAFAVIAVLPVWRAARLYCFHNYDLGIYSQALALLSPGNLNPWISGRQLHIFNDHFDPIILLAAPWTRLLPAWQVALLVESVLVALSVVPVWWLWRRGRLSASAAGLLSALVLLGPTTLSALRFPVHPTTWAMLPITWLVAALLERRTVLMLVALNLLFACKEEFPFVGLVLGVALLYRREWRPMAWVLALSVAWLALDFAVRPALLGPTEAYGPGLFAGVASHPWTYLVERLFAKGAASRIGSILVVIAPLALFAWRTRRQPDWLVVSLLLPMLAIRFLGMAWRFHYGAPVGAVAIMAFVPVLGTARVPRWLVVATTVLLISANVHNLRFTAKMWGLPSNAPPRHCPADPARIAALDVAVNHLVTAPPGPALVEGNLVAHLAARPDVYMVGGLQREASTPYRYVLVEKPPHGDPYPMTGKRIEELLPRWRQEAQSTYRDDVHLFFAAGKFTTSQ